MEQYCATLIDMARASDLKSIDLQKQRLRQNGHSEMVQEASSRVCVMQMAVLHANRVDRYVGWRFGNKKRFQINVDWVK